MLFVQIYLSTTFFRIDKVLLFIRVKSKNIIVLKDVAALVKPKDVPFKGIALDYYGAVVILKLDNFSMILHIVQRIHKYDF